MAGGHDRVKNYGWESHPVLAHGRDEFVLGEYVEVAARRHLRGSRPELQPAGLPPTVPPEDDNLAVLARSLNTKLGGQDLAPPAPVEPRVEADRLADHDHDWELSVSDEVAFEHGGLVDELVAALSQQPGVDEAHREDREVILLRAPGGPRRTSRPGRATSSGRACPATEGPAAALVCPQAWELVRKLAGAMVNLQVRAWASAFWKSVAV